MARTRRRAYISTLWFLLDFLTQPSRAQISFSCSGALTIDQSSQDNLGGLYPCTTFTGDVNITGTAAKPQWAGLTTLDGTLNIHDAPGLNEYHFPDLVTITGDFIMNNLPQYSNPDSMPLLKTVGRIDWRRLPKFAVEISLSSLTSARSIYISDTAITDLDSGALQTAGAMTVVNNPGMKTMQLKLDNLTGPFLVDNNAPTLQLSFPQLESAQDMTIEGVANFSAPNLELINGVLAFRNNTFGNLLLPELSTVTNGLNCSGGITSLNIPLAYNITGISVVSTDSFDCAELDKLRQSGVIHGPYTCNSNVPPSSLPPTSLSPTSASPKAINVGAIVGGVIGGIVVIAVILAGMFYLGRRSKDPSVSFFAGWKRNKKGGKAHPAFGKAELHADSKAKIVHEVEGGQMRHELDALGPMVPSELHTPVSPAHGKAYELPTPVSPTHGNTHELSEKGNDPAVYTETVAR